MPRYQRRTQRIDEAILGVYFSGSNTRRIRGALAPLLKGGPLSKDAVSRLVARLKEDFNTWRERDLSSEDIRYLFLDGWYPKVRIGKKRERVPVLVILGVRADGRRVILDMGMAGEESCASWSELIDGKKMMMAQTIFHHLTDTNHAGLAQEFRILRPFSKTDARFQNLAPVLKL